VTAPNSSKPDSRTLTISEELAQAIEERIRGTSFADIDAFVTFVLARLVEDSGEESPFSEEEERHIKERLRSLGYID
jgi:hypothetical protein